MLEEAWCMWESEERKLCENAWESESSTWSSHYVSEPEYVMSYYGSEDELSFFDQMKAWAEKCAKKRAKRRAQKKAQHIRQIENPNVQEKAEYEARAKAQAQVRNRKRTERLMRKKTRDLQQAKNANAQKQEALAKA